MEMGFHILHDIYEKQLCKFQVDKFKNKLLKNIWRYLILFAWYFYIYI